MRGAIGLLLLGAAGACGSVQEATRRIDWKAPPPGPPGAAARVDDQSEPRLEGLTGAPAQQPAAGAALQRANDLGAQAAERRAAGDLPGAIALQRQAVDLRRTALGPGSPEVATAETTLAGLYAAADQYDDAEPLLRHALAIREQALGADARLTALSRNNLALLLAANGQSSEAELLYLQAIAVLEESDAKDLATVLENYAALLDDTGRPDQAETVQQRAQLMRAAK
jgi:tetratricopeptide (TPR) repeat protein